MARWTRLTRTRLAAGLAVAAVAGSVLATATLWHGQRNPILSQIPAGLMTGGIFNGIPMQAEGRAYVIDDGVTDRVVTMQGRGGYTWGGSSGNPMLHVIDTATGRLLWSVTLNSSAGGGQYVTNLATGRVFAIDPNSQQITVLDARQGTILASPAWPTDRSGAPLTMTNINASLIDPRSDHIFLYMASGSSSWGSSMAPSQSQPQVVMMLDGRSGRPLRVLNFPPGPLLNSPGPNGTTFTNYSSTLSLTLDPRPDRLDIFDARGRITVVDTVSGRVVRARRLRTAIAGAIMDDRTGRIFGLDATKDPRVVGGCLTRYGYRFAGGVVMIDAATGAVLRRLPGGVGLGVGWGGAWGAALDERTGHLFVANRAGNSLSVVDAVSGRVLRTVAPGAIPLQVASDPIHRRVLVVTTPRGAFIRPWAPNSTLVVLDARDGAVLRTIPLGQPAALLAVDSLTGHLVMDASSIQPVPTDSWGWMPSAVRSRLPAIPPPPPTLGPSQQVLHSTVLIVDPSGS